MISYQNVPNSTEVSLASQSSSFRFSFGQFAVSQLFLFVKFIAHSLCHVLAVLIVTCICMYQRRIVSIFELSRVSGAGQCLSRWYWRITCASNHIVHDQQI